jgi:hypothetical protein
MIASSVGPRAMLRAVPGSECPKQSAAGSLARGIAVMSGLQLSTGFAFLIQLAGART